MRARTQKVNQRRKQERRRETQEAERESTTVKVPDQDSKGRRGWDTRRWPVHPEESWSKGSKGVREVESASASLHSALLAVILRAVHDDVGKLEAQVAEEVAEQRELGGHPPLRTSLLFEVKICKKGMILLDNSPL